MSAIERIRQERLVAILRRATDVDGRVARLVEAGVRVVEITLDDPDALAAIERARARGDLTVLAGTVRRADEVDAAVAAGAEAVVGPGFDRTVVERAAELGVAAIPGALTPTEVATGAARGRAAARHGRRRREQRARVSRCRRGGRRRRLGSRRSRRGASARRRPSRLVSAISNQEVVPE